MLKLIYLLPLLIILPMSSVWATPLENQELSGTSSNVNLDIKFGEDDVKTFSGGKERITPTLENVILEFYGDTIDLSDSDVKVTKTGNHFRISNVEMELIMYGHLQPETDNYKINIYLTGPDGFTKYPVTTAFHLPDDKIVGQEIIENKSEYVPELMIRVDHGSILYWKNTFSIEVVSYDKNVNDNPDRNQFDGRINDVDIIVILSLDNEIITTLEGTTQYGEWIGEYYIVENLTKAGEYTVNVIATNQGETVSEISNMFVIGQVDRMTDGNDSN